MSLSLQSNGSSEGSVTFSSAISQSLQSSGKASLASAPARKARGSRPRLFAKDRCQADGCSESLSNLPYYNRRNHICPAHKIADEFMRLNNAVRFCQRCGLAHPLRDFDGVKKSCRAKLQKHNQRRRKGASATTAPTTAKSPSSTSSGNVDKDVDNPPLPPPPLPGLFDFPLSPLSVTANPTTADECVCCATTDDECVCCRGLVRECLGQRRVPVVPAGASSGAAAPAFSSGRLEPGNLGPIDHDFGCRFGHADRPDGDGPRSRLRCDDGDDGAVSSTEGDESQRRKKAAMRKSLKDEDMSRKAGVLLEAILRQHLLHARELLAEASELERQTAMLLPPAIAAR
jgi:hypothetical protein